ncbi:MAG: hypothetical protein AAB426_09045 [Myxococcota bacterium]
MSGRYILVDGEPKPCPDLMEWVRWFAANDRKVARTDIADGVHVSTVFLCVDHSFGDVGPPLLFETMVFGGALDEHCERYATMAEAVAGHARIVAQAQTAEAKPCSV